MRTLSLIALLVLTSIAASGTFSFAPSTNIQCAGVAIDVQYFGSPCVVDWDGDGLKDLITGQFYYGNIRFYKNEGTNEAPVFNTFSYLQADGSSISMGYG